MPRSKQPRKKGKRTMGRALKYSPLVFPLTKAWAFLQTTDSKCITKAQFRELLAVERLATTNDENDYSMVGSALTIAALLTKRLDLTDECAHKFMATFTHGGYMLETIVRLRARREEVPQGNIEVVRDAVTTAQELIEYAYNHDRQAYVDCLHQNRNTVSREACEARERFMLGKFYDKVQAWKNPEPVSLSQGVAHAE